MRSELMILLVTSAVIGVFMPSAQGAIVAEWLLDENSITSDATEAVDTQGNWNGLYKDGAFFGAGDATSVTGHDGTPNSAVKFTKEQYVAIEALPDSSNPLVGGIAGRYADEFMIEFWFQLHGTGILKYSESLAGSGGPEIMLDASNTYAQFQVAPWHWEFDDEGEPNPLWNVAKIEPANGLDYDHWYYIAGVLKSDSEQLFLYDGTTLLDDFKSRESGFVPFDFDPPMDHLEKVRINGSAIGNGAASTWDDVRIFDKAFDENSYLFLEFGIPEPASLAVLGLGSLLLTRRRQRM